MSYGPPPMPPPPEATPSASGHGLHPMSIGQIVELSLRMLRFRWRPIYGAAALFLVPTYVVMALLQPLLARPIFDWLVEFEAALAQLRPGQQPQLPPLPAGFFEAVVAAILLGLLAGIISFVAVAAVIHAAGETYEGRAVSARRSAGAAVTRLGGLLGIWLVVTLVVLALALFGIAAAALLLVGTDGGLLAFVGLLVIVVTVVAVVFINVRWALAVQSMMLERRGALAALGRSWRVVAGSTWRVLGYLLVVGITLGLLGGLLQAFIGQLLAAVQQREFDSAMIVVEGILGGIISILLLPVGQIVVTLLYYDLRWRRGEFETVDAAGGQPAGQSL